MRKILILYILFFSDCHALSQEPRILLPSYHTDDITHIEFSNDGSLFLTCSNDNTVKIWDVKTGACRVTYTGHDQQIRKAIFIRLKHHQGLFVATASVDNTAHVFNAFTGEKLFELNDHQSSVIDIDYSAYNDQLITTGIDNHCFVYDMRKGKLKREYENYNLYGGITVVPDSIQTWYDVETVFNISISGNRINIFNNKMIGHTYGFTQMIETGNQVRDLFMSPSGRNLTAVQSNTTIGVHDIVENTFSEIKIDSNTHTGMLKSKLFQYDVSYLNDSTLLALTHTGIYRVNLRSNEAECLLKINDVRAGKLANSFAMATIGKFDPNQILRIDLNDFSVIDTVKTNWMVFDRSLGTVGNTNTFFYLDDEKIHVIDEKGRTKEIRVLHYRNRLEKKVLYFEAPYLNTFDLSTGRENRQKEVADNFYGAIDTSLLNLFRNPNYDGNNFQNSYNRPFDHPIEPVAFREEYEDNYHLTLIRSNNDKYIAGGHPFYSSFLCTVDSIGHINQRWNRYEENVGTSGSVDKYYKNYFIEPHYSHRAAHFTKDNKTLFYTGIDHNIYRYDLEKGVYRELEGHCGFPVCLDLTPDNKLLVSGGLDNSIFLWDAKKGKQIASLGGHSTDVVMTKFIDNGRRLLSQSRDGKTLIWNMDSASQIASFQTIDSHPILTAGNYFLGSPDISKHIYYELDGKIYPFSQFDLKFNRPDIVLKQLGYADDEIIQSYFKAFEKRLSKLGFTVGMLSSDFNVPTGYIVNSDDLPPFTDKEKISIQLQFRDSLAPLDRVRIWVNNVPIFGVGGISLSHRNIHYFDTTIFVELNYGDNTIQTSALNQTGGESFRQGITVNNTLKSEPGDLHFIGIGVKDYKDSTMNLAYSDKDIRDMAEMLSNAKGYGTVYIDTLLNENVTTSILPEIRKRLEQTSIHDQVIFMYSGHGLLDEELNYYLSTHDVDFLHPQEQGLLYDDVNDLFDGIPARKKLILLDACHSGELEKDEVELTASTGNLKEKDFSKASLNSVIASTGNSFELMKELFADLRRGTGATVISSSSGKYYSYEDATHQNGIYTYALKEGLQGAADNNNDQVISVSELKTYLYHRVSELTNGKQKPTTREENLEFDFRVY